MVFQNDRSSETCNGETIDRQPQNNRSSETNSGVTIDHQPQKDQSSTNLLKDGQAALPFPNTNNPCQPIPEELPNPKVSDVSSNCNNSDSMYVLPPRSTRGNPPHQSEPSLNVKSKYSKANFVSTHRLSKSHASFMNQISSVCVPSKVHDVLKDPKWAKAMNEEMEALEKNNTWELVPALHGKRTVGCRWVFTVKHNADESINKYKARLVVKGYTQTYGVDHEETFAPVAKINKVRVLLSLAANLDWSLQQFDVKSTFLHGELSEEVYMDLPPGYEASSEGKFVCKLNKS